MTEEFVVILKKLIADQGIGILDDAKICRSFLLDYTQNTYKSEIKLFIKALENFGERLRKSSNRDLDKKLLAKMWHDDDSVDIGKAENALNCLCHILFNDLLKDVANKTPLVAPESVPAEQVVPIAAKVIQPSESISITITNKPLENANSETLLIAPVPVKQIVPVPAKVIQPNVSIFTDPRDGKVYRTVKIGTQTWMAENLNYDIKGLFGSKSKCYDNDPKNAEKYGRLYDWKTAKKVAPPGWHLPTDKEWQILVDFAGGDNVAGKKLNAKSGWYNNCGTDDYDFSALPGGHRFYNDGSFNNAGSYGYWWSATECDTSYAYRRIMSCSYSDVHRGSSSKSDGFSVRCLQDFA